jgi:hypothetical protein
MELTYVYINGRCRVHGHGCRDIAREANNASAYRVDIEASTQLEAIRGCWDDIISGDRDFYDSPAAIASLANDTQFLPCVGNLPKE